MSAPKLNSDRISESIATRASEKSLDVMEQLRGEIPGFDLDRRTLTIQDETHRNTMTWEDFIAIRYAEAIADLLLREKK